MKYTGVFCPVCGGVFDDDSDVVVCPECGTPHHRACYVANNKCIYEDQHSESFAWVNPNKPAEPVEKAKKKSEPLDPSKINKENMPKNGVIGEMETGPLGMGTPNFREIKGNEKIGDFTVDDYAGVVAKNIPKFIPRFLVFSKTGKKVSWNWAAFFFGPFYLAYRKMYKYAFLSLFLIFLIPLICFNEVTEYYDASANLYSNVLTAPASSTTEEMESVIADMEANMPEEPRAILISSYIEMAIDVLCGLFANYLYYNKCTKTLTKACKIENFDARVKFIKRRSGRSFLGVIVLIVGFYAIAIAIAVLYWILGTDLATVLRKYIK